MLDYSDRLDYLLEEFKSNVEVLTLFPEVSIAAHQENLKFVSNGPSSAVYVVRHKTTNRILVWIIFYSVSKKARLTLDGISCAIQLKLPNEKSY